MELLNENEWVFDSCAISWASFFSRIALSSFDMMGFDLPYYISLCHVCLFSLESLFLSNEGQKESRSGREDEEEMGNIEDYETIIRIYCIIKIYIQ